MISLISAGAAHGFRNKWKPADVVVRGVAGRTLTTVGLLPLVCEIDGVEARLEFRVVEGIEQPMILGMDFCHAWNIEVLFGADQWRTPGGEWRAFAPSDAEGAAEPEIFAECAGISAVEDEQRKRVERLVESLVPPPGDTHGFTTLIEHHIEVEPGARPVRHAPRRMSPKILEFCQEEVKRMHERGIIEPSASEWCSAPVIVRRDGGSYRFCVDFRDLNRVTKRDAFPATNMDSILDRLRNARFISKIDLRKAYFQVLLSEVSRHYTAFAVPGSGLWQFLRLPFGVVNGGSTFTRLISHLFGPEVQPHVFGYLDDVILVTETFEEHLEWLEFVLKRIVESGLEINPAKSEFCCSSVVFLGYRLDGEGLRPDPERLAPVRNYPAPQNVKQLRTFLGMVGWYSRFIKGESDLKIPLVKLLRKAQEWRWDAEQQAAFAGLKEALIAPPVLARPDFDRTFSVQSDASDYALGAVLTQEDDDGHEHPIVYISRVLTPAERNYTTTEKECLALLWAIKKFRPYLEGYQFTAVTDHSALKWLRELKEPTGRLARWVLEMQQWDFLIVHKKGALHHVPDALSRGVNLDVEEVAAFETVDDPWYVARIRDVRHFPRKFPNWKVEDEMLYRYTRDRLLDPVTSREEGWRLVVPGGYKERVLSDAHCHPSSGHLGVEKTYDRVARDYYWQGVYHDVRRFVLECEVCQRYKVSQEAPAGLMGKRIVESPWAVVAADVMELPRSKTQYKYVLVFQDLFTRWIELKPLRAATAKAIVAALEDLILFRWEAPDYLLTDNGTEFVNRQVAEALREYGVAHVTTPPYHPQANPVERANRTLKTMIAAFVDADHRSWDEHLPAFRHALNTAVQASTRVSPAFLNLGRHPRPVKSLRREVEAKTPMLRLDPEVWADRLKRLDALKDLVRKHIDRAQSRTEATYNRKRRHAVFSVGDLVLRKDRTLSSAAKGISAKLAPRYEGPFEVKEVLSPVVVTLEGSGRRTAKAHVSELKRYVQPRGRGKTGAT